MIMIHEKVIMDLQPPVKEEVEDNDVGEERRGEAKKLLRGGSSRKCGKIVDEE